MTATRNITPPKLTTLPARFVCWRVDAVQKANSGHPGAPMGMAEIAEVLWNRHLRHNPATRSGLIVIVSYYPTGTAQC